MILQSSPNAMRRTDFINNSETITAVSSRKWRARTEMARNHTVALPGGLMATIFSLIGGMVGFASAIVSMVFMDASLAVAFGIWSLSGFAVVVLGLGMALIASDPAKERTSPASPRAYRN